MIEIKPNIEHRSHCPYSGKVLKPVKVLWQGTHVCVVSESPDGGEIIEELRIGHAAKTPYQIDLAKKAIFSGDKYAEELLAKPLLNSTPCTLGTAFGMQFTGGCITLLLTVAVISLSKPDDSLTRWLVGIIAAGTIFQAFEAINFWFQSQVQSKYTVLARNSVCFLVAGVRMDWC
jgi:hypothetical protein